MFGVSFREKIILSYASDCQFMNAEKIKYLVINVPESEKRRNCILEQAVKHGIRIELVEAVSGKALTEAQRDMYQPHERSKRFVRHLSDNEQACLHSHRKALEIFLASESEYCVVLEDDALLDEQFVSGVHYLTENVGGWTCMRLYSIDCKRYDLLDLPAVAPLKLVFPRNNSCITVGYLHTRRSAEVLLEHSKTFYLETDNLWGRILMKEKILTPAVYPNLVHLEPGNSSASDIDKDDPRTEDKKTARSLLQYLRFRMERAVYSRQKMRMIEMLRKSLFIK